MKKTENGFPINSDTEDLHPFQRRNLMMINILSKTRDLLHGKRNQLPETQIPSRPTWFHFSLTNACNLSCPFCWRNRKTVKGRQFEHAPDDIIEKWLEMINTTIKVIHPGGGGEPLLHPRCGEFIQKALDLQKRTPEGNPKINIVTNGTLIDRWPVILEAFRTGRIQVVISMESADPERYKTLRRGGTLDVVEKNLQAIQNAREKGQNFQPRTKVIIESVLSRQNIEDVDGLLNFASEHGIDRINFKRLQVRSDSPKKFEHKDSVFTPVELDRLKKIASHYNVDNNLSGLSKNGVNREDLANRLPCEDVFRSARFYPNGDIYTCCSAITIKGRAGNLSRNTLGEIWHSSVLKQVRERILSGKPGSICDDCVHLISIPDQAPMLRRKYLDSTNDSPDKLCF